MGDFFKGWRRKIGVVTLVMACVALAAWYRAESVADQILVPYNSRQLTFNATSHGLDCEYYLDDKIPYPAFVWHSMSRSSLETTEAIRRANIEIIQPRHPESFRHWELGGVSAETLSGQRRIRISYWWIISALTVLSACLLLSKPRRTKPKPVPADGESHA